MSRTREIEVWVRSPDMSQTFGSADGLLYEVFTRGNAREANCKAKLIIELPERKVTISESEFDELWREGTKKNIYISNLTEYFKEKLFKDAE